MLYTSYNGQQTCLEDKRKIMKIRRSKIVGEKIVLSAQPQKIAQRKENAIAGNAKRNSLISGTYISGDAQIQTNSN